MRLFITALIAALSMPLMAGQTTETVTLGGAKVHLSGKAVQIGDKAPSVTLQDGNLKDHTIGGKTKRTQLLVIVPSIDTPICDLEARTFNEKAAEYKDVDIYVISMDLPFASSRYCAAHGIDKIKVVSDFQTKTFGQSYGMLLGDGPLKGILARSIYIIKNGKVTYKQLVPEIKQKPDFEAVLNAL